MATPNQLEYLSFNPKIREFKVARNGKQEENAFKSSFTEEEIKERLQYHYARKLVDSYEEDKYPFIVLSGTQQIP